MKKTILVGVVVAALLLFSGAAKADTTNTLMEPVANQATQGERYVGCGMYGNGYGYGLAEGGGFMGNMMGYGTYNGLYNSANYNGYGMMGGWGAYPNGNYAFELILMALFLILIVILIVWAIKSFGGHGRSGESALAILKERYAKGEIDHKEFEEMKKNLR